MDTDDNESVSLVLPRRGASGSSSGCRGKHKELRDLDSLNNLVMLESDTDSIITERRVDYPTQECDGVSDVSNNATSPTSSHCCRTGCDVGFGTGFKAEFDKHKSLVRKDIQDGTRDTEKNYRLNSKKSIWRSFLSLCTGLFFAFMSFMPLRNIQTSLYPRQHLGNFSLSCMYFSFAIGCLCSSWITQNARPKGILLIALFGHVMYCSANIYPSFFTLLPASCFFGFFHAPLWAAQELMLASYGASYTAITKIHIDKSIQQFQVVFLVFCHAAQVFGNLIESGVLSRGDVYNSPLNVTFYHSQSVEYSSYEQGIVVRNITERGKKELVWVGPFGYRIYNDLNFPGDKVNYENVVKFVFISFAVIGMTIICLFLNKPDIIIHKKKSDLTERLKEVGWFLLSGTSVSLFLLMLFSGMQQAVVIGIVTKMYGSLTLGVSMVGVMMMIYGTCQLASLLTMEKVHHKLKPSIAIFSAFIFTLGLLVWLYIWVPTEDNCYKILGYIGFWGAVDGLWQSQIQCVLLQWSTGRKEAAVTVFRTVQSLGLVLVFLLDIWVPLLTLICICGAILVFGVIFYLILEVIRSPLTSSDPPPFAL